MTRVLVVDDDPMMAEITKALRDDGHDVELAEPPSLTATIWEIHFHHARWRAAQTARLLGWCRLLAIILALGLAMPAARAEDPAATRFVAPAPGRAVELAEGQPAPYQGSLLDRERLQVILAKRVAAELERDALRLIEQDARALVAQAESRPQWATLLAVGAGCLVAGLAGGVALVVWAKQ